MKTEET